MILTKKSLTVFKNLLHDQKVKILDAVKLTNSGLFVQNRDCVIFTKKPSKKFLQNAKIGVKMIFGGRKYFSADIVKQIFNSIKSSKISKIYGEWVNIKDLERFNECDYDVADPESTYDRNNAHLLSENPTWFKINKKRFYSALEYLVRMSGKIEDLDTFDVAVTKKNLVIKTNNKETGEEVIVINFKR